jgi:hypothetical protein
MTNKITMVITNSSDGSNSIRWTQSEKVLEAMDDRASDGDETYASGDGLQTRELKFPEDFDLEAWIKLNNINPVTSVEDV